MSTRGLPAPEFYRPSIYWEERARRFAGEGDGLAAVCAYGMPGFYNRAIDLTQRMALAPWLRVDPGMRVLDVGCGVGRWSRLLAARGAEVTGVDLSPTMIGEARRRAAAAGLAERCRFEVQDSSSLDLGARFDLVLGVTMLQHILDRDALRAAVQRIARHVTPDRPDRAARGCTGVVCRAVRFDRIQGPSARCVPRAVRRLRTATVRGERRRSGALQDFPPAASAAAAAAARHLRSRRGDRNVAAHRCALRPGCGRAILACRFHFAEFLWRERSCALAVDLPWVSVCWYC